MVSITRKSVAALALAGLLAGPFAAFADASAPTVTLASAASDPTGDNPIMFTATISDPVSDFDASDISATGGQVVNFSGSGTSYSFGVVPGDGDPMHNPQPAGLVEVRVLEHRFSNNQASNYISRWYDPATAPAPTITITSGPSEGSTVASPVTFEFTTTGTGVKCSIGADASATWFDCGSPQTYTLGDSTYLFRVMATNGAGSASTTVSRTFTVSASSTATSTGSGSGSGSASTTPEIVPVTASGPVLPNGGGTPPNPNANNGQPVGSSPSAPSGQTTPFVNPNVVIPTATTPAVQTVPAEGTQQTPTVTPPATQTPTTPVVSVSGSSGTRSNTASTPSQSTVTTPADETITPPATTDTTGPLSTDGQTAAVAQSGPSAAVWFWGAIILLALVGIGWLFYRNA